MAELPTTREVPLDPRASALLFIDVQNFSVRRDGGEFKDVSDAEIKDKYGYYFERIASVAIPNMQRLQAAFRAAGIEILYTTIESLTKDGRDRSLDYKITGFHVPKGSWDGKVIDEIAPADDEIVLPKTSSSVFVSTHVDYLLRNLGVRQLVLCGLVTDQCVEFGDPRRLRPRLSGDAGSRRLRDLQPGAARQHAEGDQGLLSASLDRGAGRRDRRRRPAIVNGRFRG